VTSRFGPRSFALGIALCAAAAATAQPDAEINALLAEIERLPPEAYAANPREWQQVFELLEQLVVASKPSRAAAPAAAARAADDWAAAFAQLAAAMRQQPVVDLASRMLALGLSESAPPRSEANGSPIVELAQAVPPQREPALQGANELWAMLPLFSPSALQLMQRKAELANAGQANADSLNQGMRSSLDSLRTRAAQDSSELLALRRTGQAIAQRIVGIESMVQASAAGRADDPGQLGQWRAQLSALQAQQAEALRQLGAADRSGGNAPSRIVRPANAPPVSPAALVKDVQQRMQAATEQATDPAQQALAVARYELWLGALDVLSREEQVKAAALREGERAQGQLMQAGAEMRRLAGAMDRVTAR
jgi:hypothetical protein